MRCPKRQTNKLSWQTSVNPERGFSSFFSFKKIQIRVRLEKVCLYKSLRVFCLFMPITARPTGITLQKCIKLCFDIARYTINNVLAEPKLSGMSLYRAEKRFLTHGDSQTHQLGGEKQTAHSEPPVRGKEPFVITCYALAFVIITKNQ